MIKKSCHHVFVNHGNICKENWNFINELCYVDEGIQNYVF
jgi:hypothetical protein